jgi:hypothetical protein
MHLKGTTASFFDRSLQVWQVPSAGSTSHCNMARQLGGNASENALKSGLGCVSTATTLDAAQVPP